MPVAHPEEAVGPHYDRLKMRETRDLTFQAIRRIAALMKPGMKESEGVATARSVLKDMHLLRGWHGVYVRFGENTLCTYQDKNAPDVTLGANDIFYVDIGPVHEKWEGDGGDTFAIGEDAEMHRAAADVRRIFDLVKTRWRDEKLSGAALYGYAERVTESLGWKLNLDMAGHRLADFPHSAFHDGALAATNYTPSTELWVLEIQIRHPTRPFGAFFEDLLLNS